MSGLLLEAHQQAEALVANTRREMEKLVRQIREKGKGSALDSEEVSRLHRELEERERRLQEGARMRAPTPEKPLKVNELVPKRRVWIEKLHAHGVVENVDGKQVTVNVDGISFTMSTTELQGAQDGHDQETAEPKIQFVRPKLEGRTPSELNLIGQRVEDALEELAAFIDRSSRAGLPEVRIVHGFGTGRLRTAIQQWLARCPLVMSFHIGRDGKDPGNGGCTIVKFE